MSEEKRRELVDFEQLAKHEPKHAGETIVGCKGCHWQPFDFRPDWTQYLEHLPRFGASGYLALSDEDASWLKKQHIQE